MTTLSVLLMLLIAVASLHFSEGWKLPFRRPNAAIKNRIELPNFSLDQLQFDVKTKAIPAIIGSLLLLSNPQDSNALSSGGRSGGSSFRSSGSMRSFSSPSVRSYSNGPSISYGPTYLAPSPFIPMPYFNPFPPIIIGPTFGVFGTLVNLLIVGGMIYTLAKVLGSVGGSSFGGLVQSESATVVKLNIALNSDWGYDGIIPTIANIASSTGDLSNRRELSRLLSETSLALLRKSNDFVGVAHEAKSFNGNDQETESFFQRLAIRERSKFDRENIPSRNSIQGSQVSSLAVVSLVVALRGKNNPAYRSVRSLSDTREVLQSLAADAMTDYGENILAVEVLWAPDSPNNSISERDLIIDYPELLKL